MNSDYIAFDVILERIGNLGTEMYKTRHLSFVFLPDLNLYVIIYSLIWGLKHNLPQKRIVSIHLFSTFFGLQKKT